MKGLKTENISIKPDYLESTTVKSNKGSISYTYLLPGYAQVHLMAGDQNIKSINIYTKTSGCLSTCYTSIEDLKYLKPDSVKNKLSISTDRISDLGFKTDQTYYLGFYNMQNYEINGNYFEAEARVRNKETKNLFYTGTVHFGIWGEDGIFDIHIANERQPYILKQVISEIIITEKNMDMQPFSVDMDEWQTIKLIVKEETANIFLNGKQVLSQNFSNPIGMIKRIWF
ncbi:MAG: hypothetical protein ACOC3T_04900, partial [Bacteroidota bacterium]